MIKFELTDQTYDKIVLYENEYLANCSLVIEPYKKLFVVYGCEINYGLFWRNGKHFDRTKRPPWRENYECWFGYEITQNGQLVCYDDVEGGTLGKGEGFLYIRRKKAGIFKKNSLEVTYVDDISDLKESLKEDLLTLKELFEY